MKEEDTILDGIEDRHVLMARLEAQDARAMVRLYDLRLEQSHGVADDAMLGAVAAELAVVMKASQNWVLNRLFAYRFIKANLPAVWAAFQAGRLDGWRVLTIAESARQLRNPESRAAIDAAVAEYAADHTIARIRAWLRRWLMKLEPAEAQQRTKEQVDGRSAWVRHGQDGMSALIVTMSTPDAQVVDKQLSLDAKLNQGDKTLAQARADVVIDRLTGRATAKRSRARFHVGITMPFDSLVGLSDEPGVASDESFVLPPAEVRRLINEESALVSRLLTDEQGKVLDVTEVGRLHSPRLKRAVQLVDGICSFPTCERPAFHNDIDHADEHRDGGPTSGRNAHPACRTHHVMKTLGLLKVVIRDGALLWVTAGGREYPAVTHLRRDLNDFAA